MCCVYKLCVTFIFLKVPMSFSKNKKTMSVDNGRLEKYVKTLQLTVNRQPAYK